MRYDAVVSRRELALGLIAVLVAVFALATFEVSDSDLGFHLATGRAVLAKGHIIDRNVLSFSEPDQPWVLQQGVPAVLFELLWQWGGVTALILTKACVVAVTFATVFLAATRLGAQPVIAALVVIFAAWSCAFRFVERPLIFSNLALAVVLLALSSARSAVGRARRVWLYVAMAAVAVACQLHAGAVFSFILLGMVSVALLLEPLRAHLTILGPVQAPAGVQASLAVLGVALGAAVLAGLTLSLYHPFPLRVLEVPFVMGQDAFLAEHLIEFRPPSRFPFELLLGYWLYAGLTSLVLVAGARRLPLSAWAAAFGFLVLSLRYVRFVDVFAMVSAPILALALTDLRLRMDVRPWLRGAAVAVAVVVAPLSHWSHFPPRFGFSEHLWPTGLFTFVGAQNLRGPAFVSDGWAGPYLAFFYPRERAYFFPAFDAFSVGLFREYMDIRYGRPGWDTKLDHYGIELCILKYTSPNERRYQGGADNLRQHLAADPRWSLVDFDDLGEIFVRTAGVNRAAAEGFGVTGVDPDRVRLLEANRTVGARLRALHTYRERTGAAKSERLEALMDPQLR